MIVVSDTSPVNYLFLIDAISVLPALFGDVFIPRAVWSELCSNDSPPMVRGWAVSPPPWVRLRDPSRLDPRVSLGAGETAAMGLALDLSADLLLIDEERGRRVAASVGL